MYPPLQLALTERVERVLETRDLACLGYDNDSSICGPFLRLFFFFLFKRHLLVSHHQKDFMGKPTPDPIGIIHAARTP